MATNRGRNKVTKLNWSHNLNIWKCGNLKMW
jgi:hypothetical protein